MYAPRLLLWGVGVAGFALTVVFLSAGFVTPGVVCFLVAVTAPGAAEVYADRRKRSDWFSREFGSCERFRESVDTDTVRRLRDEKGVGAAVLSLKKQYPLVRVSEAARLVKEL
ncbi:MAG TPA: hypothetical protein VNS49_11035 [Streptomyces sp.]|nr:hypothetical protein [Streptomyces sp.]